VLPAYCVRGNIPVTNWKEVSKTVIRMKAVYFNRLLEKKRKKVAKIKIYVYRKKERKIKTLCRPAESRVLNRVLSETETMSRSRENSVTRFCTAVTFVSSV
jgi:hypothetical protein